MIKFTARTARRDGRLLLGLGLSEGNVQRLREGKPIHVHGEEVGMPGLDVVILYGETEQDIARELSPMIGPDTEVRKQAPEQ